jgi:steroid delta-isomerase-like uncharacterized protein
MKKLLVISITVFLFAIQSAKCQSTMENKKVVLRYIEEVVNQRKLDLMKDVFTDNFIRHDLMDSTEKVLTVADQQKGISNLLKAFPDIYYVVGDIIAEGDKVVMRAAWHATHKSTFMGIEASGNRIDYLSEIFFFRLENGKIVERWVQFDLYTLLKKLKGEK